MTYSQSLSTGVSSSSKPLLKPKGHFFKLCFIPEEKFKPVTLESSANKIKPITPLDVIIKNESSKSKLKAGSKITKIEPKAK